MAGERFKIRPVGEQRIKVYSNCAEVELDIDGVKQKLGGEKVFEFTADLAEGEHTITARADGCEHTITETASETPAPS